LDGIPTAVSEQLTLKYEILLILTDFLRI